MAQPSGHRSWYFSREVVPVARQVWRAFCRPGARFIEGWCDRGTRFISGREVFPVDDIGKKALVQLRGTRFISGR